MSIWADLKKTTSGWLDGLNAEIKQFKDKPMATALMATCALIAAADGNISGDEKTKMAGFIRANDTLKQYDASFLIGEFERFAAKLAGGNFVFGKMEALEVIEKVKDRAGAGRLIVQLGIIIGSADGNFDDQEKVVVGELCDVFSLDRKQFHLEVTAPV